MRYASAVEDTPRGTILTIARSYEDIETCEEPRRRFVLGEDVQVREDDGDGAVAVVVQLLKVPFDGFNI